MDFNPVESRAGRVGDFQRARGLRTGAGLSGDLNWELVCVVLAVENQKGVAEWSVGVRSKVGDAAEVLDPLKEADDDGAGDAGGDDGAGGDDDDDGADAKEEEE